jgi:hypothetical protein
VHQVSEYAQKLQLEGAEEIATLLFTLINDAINMEVKLRELDILKGMESIYNDPENLK